MDNNDAYETMLNEEELVDPFTGEENVEEVEKQQNEYVADKLDEAEKVVSLANHPGWKFICDIIREDLVKEQNSLLYTEGKMVVRLQERIKAKKDFLQFLEIKIAERDYLIQEQKAR